jgi:hypothetical protein
MSGVLPRLRRQAHLAEDPPFAAGGWYPQMDVRLDGSHLRFSRELDHHRLLLPRDGLLTRFVGLELAAAADIEDFARDWGALHLCAHGLPYTHGLYRPHMRIPPSTYLPPEDADQPPELPPPMADPVPDWWATADADERRQRTEHSWGDTEPLAGWRFLAGRMAGTYEAAALLDMKVTPSASTWERAGGPTVWMVIERFNILDLPVLRGFLFSLVNEMLTLTAPAIMIGPSGLAFGGGGLASALAMQLAVAVAREDTDFLPCMEPGCTSRARHPRRGATPYCDYHLDHGVRRRDELRRHRERQYAQSKAAVTGGGQPSIGVEPDSRRRAKNQS